jgi:FtsH Extracellular
MEADKDKTSLFKVPQGRLLTAVLILSVVFYLWQSFAVPPGPVRYPISYSRFLEQLDASNIKSVSILKLRVNGEFVNKTELVPTGSTKPVSIRRFVTYLPVFQGQGLLDRLGEKKRPLR